MKKVNAAILTLGLAACLSLDLLATSLAQPVKSIPAEHQGMMDQPCQPGTFGRPPAAKDFARAMVSDGPFNPAAHGGTPEALAAAQKADQERQARDWPDLCRYQRADIEDSRGDDVRVVFLGDSITELWQAADPQLFTRGIVDRGISGQTSAQVLLRFYADVVALHPRVVHIMVGTNDIAGNTGPERPEDFKNNIRAMVDIAKADRIRVVLASILPTKRFAWRPALNPAARVRELNAWLSDYARERGLVYADYYPVLAARDGGMQDGASRDGVHPLRSSYLRMRPVTDAALADAEARN